MSKFNVGDRVTFIDNDRSEFLPNQRAGEVITIFNDRFIDVKVDNRQSTWVFRASELVLEKNPGKRIAYITREVITIDRDYEDDREMPSIQYNVILPDASDEQTMEFHEAIDDFIRSYRAKGSV